MISEDGRVWEVKRNNEREIAKGFNQLARYVKNKWHKHENISLRLGNEISGGTIEYGDKLINYSYYGKGLIVYDYPLEDKAGKKDIELNINYEKDHNDVTILIGAGAVVVCILYGIMNRSQVKVSHG